MAEEGPSVQSEGKERKMQTVEAEMSGMGRIQGCCLDVQGWDQESQDTDGIELGKGCEKQYGFPYIHWAE